MDWTRVREELKACREAAKLSQVGLASLMEKGDSTVNKSTVNRIENVYGDPAHAPDLDTIERWVLATGVKLSEFFGRLEAQPVGTEPAPEGTITPVSLKGSHDEDRPVSPDRRALEELRAFIIRLAEVLDDAAAATYPDESQSVSDSGAEKSTGR